MKIELGTWVSTGSPIVTELAALCGLDWVLLDLEHGCTSLQEVLPQLQSIAQSSTRGIVRVGALHPEQIGQLLDWGADGIMVPHVTTAEEAHAVVRAAYHPPTGRRGVAKTVRATRYGLRTHSDLPQPTLIAQIESADAVENAPSIAAVPGISALFVGPADLQHDLAVHASNRSRTYEECLKRVSTAASLHRKAAGILLRDPEDIPRFASLGFTYLAVDSDIGILRAAYQRIVARRFTG